MQIGINLEALNLAALPANSPLLARLRLTRDELAALRRQGFVARERRGERSAVFKLRFRLAGRQRVIYLGTDFEQARAVKRELAELQRGRRQSLELARLHRMVGKTVRASKTQLAPLFERDGYHFHGHAVRRRRSSRRDGSSPKG
jgi:hypothetical protein